MQGITPDSHRTAEAHAYEQAVLGGAILDADQRAQLLAELEPNDFFTEPHRRIYRAIVAVSNRNDTVDFLSVQEELGILDFNFNYLAGLADAALFNSMYDRAVDKVKSASARRRAQAMLEGAMAELGNFDTDLVAQFKNMSDDVVRSLAPSRHMTRLGEGMVELLKGIERGPQELDLVRTGLMGLDNLVGGFSAGKLWVIGGRTSMGKSSLAQTLALNASRQNCVGYLPLEDGETELRQRLLAMEAGVTLTDIIRQDVPNELDATKIARASGALQKRELYVPREWDWQKIKARIELLKFRAPALRVVFIDHLGLIQNGKFREDWRNIGAITREAKQLAGELGISVVLVVQINRDPERRAGAKTKGSNYPTLADLRGSGNIEEDADVILLLYRKSYYDHSDDDGCDLLVAKQRNGPTGRVQLRMDRKSLRFENP